MAELERRIVAIEVQGADDVTKAYKHISAEGDKMAKSHAVVGTSGATAFKALTAGAGTAMSAILGVGAAAASAIARVAVDAVKLLASWAEKATKLVLGLAAAGATMAAVFAKGAISAAVDRDTRMRSLTSLLGSPEEARKMFAELRKAANQPGMDLNSATKFTQGMISVPGVDKSFALRTLKAMANANALSGGGPEQIEAVGRQLTQSLSKGRLLAEEVNIIAESLPQFRSAIMKAFGTADTELLLKRGMTAIQVLTGAVAEMEKLPQATSGPANALVNMKMAWNDLMVGFGEAFTGAGGIDVINKLAEGLAKISPMMASLGTQIAANLPMIGAGIEQAFKFISNPDNLANGAKRIVNLIATISKAILDMAITVGGALDTIGKGFWHLAINIGMVFQKVAKQIWAWNPWLARLKQSILDIGDSAMQAGSDIALGFQDAGSQMEKWATSARDSVVKWQDEAAKAIDRTTEAIKAQAGAMQDAAKATTQAAISAGQAYSYSANGNSYNAYTFGQAAGQPIRQDGFWNQGGHGYGMPQGGMTTAQFEKYKDDFAKTFEQDRAAANQRAIEAQEKMSKAQQEYAQRLQEWQRQLWSTIGGWTGGSLRDLVKNAADAQQKAKDLNNLGSMFPGTAIAASAGQQLAAMWDQLKFYGINPMAPSHGGPLLTEANLKLLADKSDKAKENRSVTIEGDYSKQRAKERDSLNDRLASAVIGNLGSGDQGILAQGKLGSASDAITMSAARAGRDIGSMIADAIGVTLPRAVEAAVARRMRLDYQGAN